MEWSRVSEFSSIVPCEYSNVIYLSSCSDASPQLRHKCKHTCTIQHAFANLFQVLDEQHDHVCDKNCNQKILYDNHSSICMVSRNVVPLTDAEKELVRAFGRKRGMDTAESCGRQRKHRFRNQVVVAVQSTGAAFMADSIITDA
ncbi:hypothetical protein CLOM_g2567 [Closterium sp. NIES-68]|nr:hypothetical protein CLOM_g2567 [Closterium sp. NIES-68]